LGTGLCLHWRVIWLIMLHLCSRQFIFTGELLVYVASVIGVDVAVCSSSKSKKLLVMNVI
jgi:hypothetical protein